MLLHTQVLAWDCPTMFRAGGILHCCPGVWSSPVPLPQPPRDLGLLSVCSYHLLSLPSHPLQSEWGVRNPVRLVVRTAEPRGHGSCLVWTPQQHWMASSQLPSPLICCPQLPEANSAPPLKPNLSVLPDSYIICRGEEGTCLVLSSAKNHILQPWSPAPVSSPGSLGWLIPQGKFPSLLKYLEVCSSTHQSNIHTQICPTMRKYMSISSQEDFRKCQLTSGFI